MGSQLPRTWPGPEECGLTAHRRLGIAAYPQCEGHMRRSQCELPSAVAVIESPAFRPPGWRHRSGATSNSKWRWWRDTTGSSPSLWMVRRSLAAARWALSACCPLCERSETWSSEGCTHLDEAIRCDQRRLNEFESEVDRLVGVPGVAPLCYAHGAHDSRECLERGRLAIFFESLQLPMIDAARRGHVDPCTAWLMRVLGQKHGDT